MPLSVRQDEKCSWMLQHQGALLMRGAMFNVECSMKVNSGGYSGGVPPLPIPNREVKPARADGTAHPWESR